MQRWLSIMTVCSKVKFPDQNVLTFEFRKIYLRKLDWRRYVDQANPVAAAFMAKMNYRKEERPKVKVKCLLLLAKLQLDSAKAHLIGRFIEKYLSLDESEQSEYDAIPMTEKQAVTEILT